MQDRLGEFVGAMVLVATMTTLGCGGGESEPGGGTGGVSSLAGGMGGVTSHTGGSGGASDPAGGSGGSAGGGGSGGSDILPAECTDVSSCGGEVTGTWTVASSCLLLSGALDPATFGLQCATAPVTGGALQVTGSLTAGSDGSYSDETVTSGTVDFTLDATCLVYSSTPIVCDQAARIAVSAGFTDTTCTGNADGGCSCSGTVEQTGGLGRFGPNPLESGTYTTSGSVLTATGLVTTYQTQYSYCASASTLILTPLGSQPTLAGTVVLQREGTTGSGGAPGTGGAPSGGAAIGGAATGGASSGGVSSGGLGTGGVSTGGAPSGGAATGGLVTGGASTGGAATGGAVTGGADSGGAATGGAVTGGAGTGGAPTGGTVTGGAGTGGAASPEGPCDVFAEASTPCVAAHSTVRALFADYDQPLYQVRRVSDGTTQDIPLLTGSGIADASVQEEFCGATSRACTISIIYDQTGNGNDLMKAEVCPNCSGCPSDSSKRGQPDVEAFADLARITIAGHTAYGVRILPCGNGIENQTGYRVRVGNGTATGDEPESVYFVVDGEEANSSCCFDYGNASTDLTASGNMNAVEFSRNKYWGYGEGDGPWVAADLEAGVYTWNGGQGSWMNPDSLSLPQKFVTALLKNNQNGQPGGPFVLKGANAQSGSLITMWDGARPSGYETLRKQGGIVLGIGGDNAAGAAGNFYEGAITTNFNSSETDDALQANIVAAGYGQ